MNIYFLPTERNEVTLSSNITNSLINIDESEKINPSIDDDLNNEDIEINELYKKYTSKNSLFEKTKSQKKLNKVKVYFIVKSKIVKGKEINYAVPIRSFDDLGNTILEKSKGFIASIFFLRADKNLYGLKYIEGSPGARPFRLEHVIDTEPPFEGEQEFPLENLILPKKYIITGGKIKLVKKRDNLNKMVLDEPSFEELNSNYFFPSEYEYKESMIDNTTLSNSSRYSTDIRQKNSFNGDKEDNGFLSRLKELTLKEERFKFFNLSNIFSLVFGNMDALVDKNIIPVFSNVEDAQDLLITILEELNQPFQVRRKVENIENADTIQYTKSLNFLDDSFSFQNNFFLPGPKTKTERAQDLLLRYGIIKLSESELSKNSDYEFYNENKYQIKGPFFIEGIDTDTNNDVYVPMSQQTKSAPKCIWRETDYWSFINNYFPGQHEAYSWWESRDMTAADKGLLKKSQDIKIISMGLGDFLEFWNNPTKKNAEVLFIPSPNDLNKRKLPLLTKKSRDKFYDYQQKFRESKKQDTENYIYEIKLSAE